MLFYLQLEANNETAVPANGIVKFNTIIDISQSNSLTPPEDFVNNQDGTIEILRPGMYAVFWNVSGMEGFATNGQSYQLRKVDYSVATPEWTIIAGGSNQIKDSPTPGFAIVAVSKEEIINYEKATVALFNTADNEIGMTIFIPKANILFFGVNFAPVETELSVMDGQITDIFSQLQAIENFVHLSNVTEIYSLTSELSGLGIAVIHSGYTYNFWGIGTLNHQQTLTAGQTYYLITASQYEPLLYYQGSSTIGTLWIETPAPLSEIYSFPIRFDASGIYYIPNVTYQNLPAGTTFKFTRSLILVDSSN